jgi:hypothetical protein
LARERRLFVKLFVSLAFLEKAAFSATISNSQSNIFGAADTL